MNPGGAVAVATGYLEISDPLAARGIPTIPLQPRSKIALLEDWQAKATTDFIQMRDWDERYPEANAGSVALAVPDGFWFLEIDKPEVVQRIESETRQQIPNTFRVRSSPGRGHYYWKQSPASIAMGNIAQGYVQNADWSARVDRQYVVAPGSIHPTTGKPYEVVSDAKIIAAPEWLIEWLISQKVAKTQTSIGAADPIPHGAHDTTLTSIAGQLRRANVEADTMTDMLIEICEKRCVNYGTDYRDMCRKIADSVCRYKPADPADDVVIFGPKTQAMQPKAPPDPAAVAAAELDRITNWKSSFRSVAELPDGGVAMLINGFLPEGFCLIGALPGETKTLLLLSIAKALTSGKPLLGNPDWSVPERRRVIYMIPESSARAFKTRCRAFGITEDKDWFMCRTISEGGTLMLTDPVVQQAAREGWVFVLDTLIRFSESDDENNASQNKKLGNDVTTLRQLGSPTVLAAHHATKLLRSDHMTMENVLRGTGDIAALADAVYGLKRDDELYAGGAGPLEINVQCIKPRDFEPPLPFRLAAKRLTRAGEIGEKGMASIIDETGDFRLITQTDAKLQAFAKTQKMESELTALVRNHPAITLTDLRGLIADHNGVTIREVRATLMRRGWTKLKGKGHLWTHTGALPPVPEQVN